ncbi:MAG: hypothetical protein IT260_06020 [Saprospiraceae bacterium]|nr:hypothetical protein [Saprospiraceae bacterium]
MADNIIIIDIIISQTTAFQQNQLCNDLSRAYFTTNAVANNLYTFGWGPDGGMSGALKISVGAAQFLINYNSSTQKAEVCGACGNTSLADFEASGQVLTYHKNGFAFTVQFHLIDGASIEITVRPGSNTSIAASSENSFA